MTSRSAPEEPSPEDGAPPPDRSAASDGSEQQARPEPLKDEIAKDTRRSSGGAARFEVRFRRLVLLVVILIPVIWWIAVRLT